MSPPIPAITTEELEAIGLVIGASILAGLIGLEREASEKPAGFRTHMLVGGAAALLVILGRELLASFEDLPGTESFLRADPIRIIEAIIVGVSFIGAGTILKVEDRHRVRYLTTAASILFSAGVGIAVALKQFYLAIFVVLTVLAITFLLGRLANRVED